jgi:hypothetical protein
MADTDKREYAVCGATMNSTSLGNISHDLASIGTVSLVELTAENKGTLTNTLYCFSEAKEFNVLVSRLPDVIEQSQIDRKYKLLVDTITKDKFFGKKVKIVIEEESTGLEAITGISKITIIK